MNNSVKLSDHFTLAEACVTSTGISNVPPTHILSNMLHTALKMEDVRKLLDSNPIRVNSWYRSEKVNRAVGGSSTSQHTKGEAVDFTCEGYGTPYEICQKLSQHKLALRFDQLIYEGTWVHVSFLIPPRVPRLEVLTYMLDKSYQSGLTLNRGVR